MIKCGKKDKKNYLDMQNQIGFECISSNMNVFFFAQQNISHTWCLNRTI